MAQLVQQMRVASRMHAVVRKEEAFLYLQAFRGHQEKRRSDVLRAQISARSLHRRSVVRSLGDADQRDVVDNPDRSQEDPEQYEGDQRS